MIPTNESERINQAFEDIADLRQVVRELADVASVTVTSDGAWVGGRKVSIASARMLRDVIGLTEEAPS